MERKSRSAVNETIEQITEGNIESILRLEQQHRASKPAAYRAVERIARFCGTLTFLWMNIAVFVGWVLLQTVWEVDPYPYTFLLFIVSLEAIVLSILILISQNMTSAENERRHHLDLQINLLNEREMTALLRLSVEMAAKLGIRDQEQKEVASLSQDTDPAAVLHQIDKAEEHEPGHAEPAAR